MQLNEKTTLFFLSLALGEYPGAFKYAMMGDAASTKYKDAVSMPKHIFLHIGKNNRIFVYTVWQNAPMWEDWSVSSVSVLCFWGLVVSNKRFLIFIIFNFVVRCGDSVAGIYDQKKRRKNRNSDDYE